MTELISAVAAVVAILLGIVTYVVQKSLERSNNLMELRRRHYLNFIEKNMMISQRLDEAVHGGVFPGRLEILADSEEVHIRGP